MTQNTPQQILNRLEVEIQGLENTRQEQLAENMEIIEAARLIAQRLGKDARLSYRPSWQANPAFQFVDGNIKITLVTGLGDRYLPLIKEFEDRQNLEIYFKDYLVCRYYFTNNNEPHKPEQHIFVPGKWTDIIKEHIEQAIEKNINLKIQERQKDLDQLKMDLLIGVDL